MPARYHKHRPKDDPDVAAREAAERGASFSVLVELAFERCDPSGTAYTMSQAFMQVRLACACLCVSAGIKVARAMSAHSIIFSPIDATTKVMAEGAVIRPAVIMGL